MDPVTGAAIATAGANVVGSLLGASSSSKESKANRREARRQFNIQDDYNKNMTQYRVSDALKAGINPLAALGMSGSYSPTASSGGSSGASEHIANGFSALGKGISSMFEKRAHEESVGLSLENQQLQNEYLRAQINNMAQPAVPTGQVKPQIGDLYLPWKDKSGNVVWLLNPDAIADADITNIEAVKALASTPEQGVVEPAQSIIERLRTGVGSRESYYRRARNYVHDWLNSRANSTGKYWLYGRN